jgi:hypothetical protein
MPLPPMYGIPIPDPRSPGQLFATCIDELKPVVMDLVRRHHHPDTPEVAFTVKYFSIGPPRGKSSGIARMEINYQRDDHTYSQVFAVTDSAEHGLRLWTEVRKYVRPS